MYTYFSAWQKRGTKAAEGNQSTTPASIHMQSALVNARGPRKPLSQDAVRQRPHPFGPQQQVTKRILVPAST